jgi:hypothetical protein
MKTFNGKAIYNPSGKAGEYSYWACNFTMVVQMVVIIAIVRKDC